MDSFAITLVAGFVFLLIASFSLKPSERFNIPHSVFLVLVGILLAFIIREVPSLAFLGAFQLSPELIFFVFLPTLLFESAFKFPLRKLQSDALPIFLMSIFGYLISVGVITLILWGATWAIGISFPPLALLLFSVIISATDPVAVLSVFKKLGVTPRLTHLFEGESLFNDGTSYAFFLILIAFLGFHGGDFSQLNWGITGLQFFVMFFGGIGFGIAMGYLFTFLIAHARGEENIQLTLSLVMAHLTFLLADLSKHILHFGEHHFEFSAIIATVMASIILGSRGIQKFDPEVRKHMDVLWEHFAFIANSLIFILIGMLTIQVMHFENLKTFGLITLIAIGAVIIARVCSVYIPLMGFNVIACKHQKISYKWMKILSWGSLRGAIAIASLLMIPEDITVPGWSFDTSVKEAITTMVISCILFTTFVKAMMLEYFVEKMGLSKFSHLETLETLEGKILTITAIVERLDELKAKEYISSKNAVRLIREYKTSKKQALRKLACFFSHEMEEKDVSRFIHLHALIIEKKMLQILLDHNEITEYTFWVLHDKLLKQEERLRAGEKQVQGSPLNLDTLKIEDVPLRYQVVRARSVILRKVLRRLQEFQEGSLCIPKKALDVVIKKYEQWADRAESSRIHLLERYPKVCRKGEYQIFSHYTRDLEDEYINKLTEKSILNIRVSRFLKKEGLR